MKSAKIKTVMFGRSACQDRSERTRQRLIEVAVEVFADLGYEAASTRTIVEKAQANLVSIPYYFGSKLGLYHAVAEYIGINIMEQFRPVLEKAREHLKEPGQSREQTLKYFVEFIVGFARIMLSAAQPAWGRFIYREQFDPTEAFEIIHAKFAPTISLGCEFVSRLTGQPVDATETRIQVLAIFSMIKFTRMDRASVLRIMGWKSVGNEEMQIVTEMLRQNVNLLFAQPK